MHFVGVIALPKPRYRDNVQDIETASAAGIVVPGDSAQALAEAMQRLASEPTLAERMGQQALAAVREKFSIDAVADILEGRYRAATTTTKAIHRAQQEESHD